MYQLFNLAPAIATPVWLSPRWPAIRDGLRRNLHTAIQFYRTNPMATRSDHFLVRLLQSIPIPKSQIAERYVDNVSAMSEDLSMALKMTSSRYKGQVFTPGVFYGPAVAELLISNPDRFDPYEAEAKWRDLVSVKVLRHPVNNLTLQIPDGRERNSEEGLAVIAINIPLLALQYRCFVLEERARFEEYAESPKSIMQFLHQYVLPNMLPSHLDYAIFNRMECLTRNLPLGEALTKTSFFLPNFTPRVDAVLEDIAVSLKATTRSWHGMLCTVPAVSKASLESALELPKIARTRQVEWALAVSRVPVLNWLMSMSIVAPRTRNGTEANRILRRLRAYESDSVLNQTVRGGAKMIMEAEFAEAEIQCTRT